MELTAEEFKEYVKTEAGQWIARLFMEAASAGGIQWLNISNPDSTSIRFIDEDHPLFDEYFGTGGSEPPEEPGVTYDANGISLIQSPINGGRIIKAVEDRLTELESHPNVVNSEFRSRIIERINSLRGIYWLWPDAQGLGYFSAIHEKYYQKVNQIRVDLNDDGDYNDPGEVGLGYWMGGVMAGFDRGGQQNTGDGDWVMLPTPHLEGDTLDWAKALNPETGFNERQALADHAIILANNRLDLDAVEAEALNFINVRVADAGNAQRSDFD